jgi:ABC-type multidrug transport system ATPase subunit/CubicO group peptidase (beta-lactamase class C family)
MMLRWILGIFILATPGFAQDLSRIHSAVHSYVSRDRFMGSVLIARGGQIVFSKGYGYADVERRTPNTPSTRFPIGSLTKQFTAAAVLLLEEQGKLKVTTPITYYLPNAPAAWEAVRVVHLLTDTAGIRNIDASETRTVVGFPDAPERLLALFRYNRLEFAPGTRRRDSNTSRILLGCLIEKVSGQTSQSFIEENIFRRLRMHDSGYETSSAVVSNRARGYSPGPNGPVPVGTIDMSVQVSAGALYSTTEDLLRWEQGLFGGGLLSPASLRTMTTPYKPDYACGLSVKRVNGRKQISHDAGIYGFNARLAYFPESKMTVAVLSNMDGGAPTDVAGVLEKLAHGDNVVTPPELKAIIISAGILIAIVISLTFVHRPQKPPKTEGDKVAALAEPAVASEPSLDIRDLCFSYGSVEVLHGISFRIRCGEMVGLLGPNGAGKSTTLKIIAGIHGPDRGKVHIAGLAVPEQHLQAKRIIGYLPESPLLYECLSGMEFLELMGRLQGLAEKTLHARIGALLEAFDLINIRFTRLSSYSKGMRQKILLAAALLHDPRILLLDEPLSGLDVDTSILIKDLLLTLSAHGKTILYSSHVLDVVEKVCHRVILVDHGNILADAPLEELKARTGEQSLEVIFRKLTHSEDTGPKIARVMEALQT